MIQKHTRKGLFILIFLVLKHFRDNNDEKILVLPGKFYFLKAHVFIIVATLEINLREIAC